MRRVVEDSVMRDAARERPTTPPAHDAPTMTAKVLALQRAAGNHATSLLLGTGGRRLLSRGIEGYTTGSTAEHKAIGLKGEPMVTVVQELEDPEGTTTWLLVKEVASARQWMYVPPRSGGAERYVPWKDMGTHSGYLKTQKKAPKPVESPEAKEKRKEQAAAENAAEDLKVRGELTAGTWGKNRASTAQRFGSSEEARKKLKQDLALGMDWQKEAAGWGPPYDSIVARVTTVFPALTQMLDKEGAVEMTGDLIAKVGQVVDPLRPDVRAQKDPSTLTEPEQRELSQAMAEVDYLFVVVVEKPLKDPYVLGAKSRMQAPGQITPIEKEKEHGALPPLHTLNFEVDGYYRTADGVLHADEVKDSPRAFGEKVRIGEQLGRQVQWLELPVADENGPIKKRVGYFVRGTAPKFDTVLDPGVIANLQRLDKYQPDEPFIRIATQSFTVSQLQKMLDDALVWLNASRPALMEDAKYRKGAKLNNSKVFEDYFDDLLMAQKNIATGPLKPTATATAPDTVKT